MIQVINHDYPFASLHLYFRPGSRRDPDGLEGLTYLTAHMMMRGAGDRNYAEFSEALDCIGASLDIGVGRDTIAIEGDTLTRNLPGWLALTSDALRRPRFEPEELERLKRQTIAENEERRDSDEDLCAYIMYQELSRPDPAGRPIKGTAESLNRITIADIRRQHSTLMSRADLVAGACGDLEDDFEARVMDSLALPQGEHVEDQPYTSADPGRVRVILVDKPDRSQTQIMAGRLSLPVSSPDYYPLMVSNTVFGGTFTARLSQEIREKRGWSYGANSSLVAQRTTGMWNFHFYPAADDAVKALALGLDLHRQWASDGITAEELTFASSYLTNRFPFHLQTPRHRLMEKLRLRLLGLPADETSRYMSNVAAVTVEQANAATARHLPPGDLTVVMVCTAADLIGEIAALPSVDSVEVHPYDQDW
ncbi:MAG: zinc protease [Myxococcota bacterium]|jgi:zinc protease